MNPNELHIDLLRCEHCGQHNKLLLFCSACGRARTKVIIAQPHEYKLDRQSSFMCRSCYSQRRSVPFCIYCNRGMKAIRSHQDDQYLDNPSTEMEERELRYDPLTGRAKKKARREAIRKEPTVPIRVRVYERDGGCLRCRKDSNLTLHHVVHVAEGGKNTMENLQTLCVTCHRHIHEGLIIPSGTPYRREDEFRSQEDEDAEWNRIRRERAKKHGKKPGSYTYSKGLATNLAAPEIARLRKQ